MKLMPARALAVLSLLLMAGACAAPQTGTFTPAPIVPVVAMDAVEEQDPTAPFTLSVVDGLLEEVNVTSDRSETIEGTFSEDLTTWTSEGILDAGSTHTVVAKAVSSDGTVTEFEQQFTTEARESSGFAVADVTPVAEGEEVGVGAPLIVTFTEDAPDRAAVEQLLVVESEKGHEGGGGAESGTGAPIRQARSAGPGANLPRLWPARSHACRSPRFQRRAPTPSPPSSPRSPRRRPRRSSSRRSSTGSPPPFGG